MERNTKVYLMPLIAVSIFTVLLFTAGYAYFTSTINMNTANYQISMPKTTSLVCTKTDCNVTITPAMMTNTNTNATVAKGTSNCSVSCTCSGTEGAQCNYNVTLLEKGSPYTPSSGLGSNKEFTVKVTNQAGCTIQNSSSTVTQVNSMKDKIVANCTLTVPSSGSVSSTTSAEFKWYNLNLDQSRHANSIYEYELTTSSSRKIIFIENAADFVRVGDDISELTNGYQTNSNTLTKKCYLKSTVENNKIIELYACVKYSENGILKETCLRGGDGGASYGTYDGMSSMNVKNITGATGNIKKVQSIQHYTTVIHGGECDYNSFNSICDSFDEAYFAAYHDGSVVIENYTDGCMCHIDSAGQEAAC